MRKTTRNSINTNQLRINTNQSAKKDDLSGFCAFFAVSLLNEKYHEKQIVITSRTFSHYLCILSTQEENRAGKGSRNRSYLYKSAT